MESAIMYKNIAKIRKVCNIEGMYTVVPLGRDGGITDTMCYYTGHLLQAGPRRLNERVGLNFFSSSFFFTLSL